MTEIYDEDKAKAAAAVFKKSVDMNSVDDIPVKGIDFDDFKDTEISARDLAESLYKTGFQGTNLGYAIQVINNMIKWEGKEENEGQKCTIFLGYTSNLVSSGLREILKFLVKNKMVSCIVTTGGGIEEDFIKCMAPTYLGDFNLDGKALREKGLNRIGNLLVPNNNYCKFEDWIIPILDQMVFEQNNTADRTVWTPSKIIRRLGKEINNEESIYYWAYKNDIPVFCPAITDGSLGDMIYFHSFRAADPTPRLDSPTSPLIVDIASDLRMLNTISVRAACTGVIILGGGLVKHHISNANMMRNGADYAVYINTGQEFDGSDAGARPDEAVSWGKIKGEGQSVKVTGDATILFPLVVAATFAKLEKPNERKN